MSVNHFRFPPGFATLGQRQNWSLPKEYDIAIMGKKPVHTWRLNKETKRIGRVKHIGRIDKVVVSVGSDFCRKKKYQ